MEPGLRGSSPADLGMMPTERVLKQAVTAAQSPEPDDPEPRMPFLPRRRLLLSLGGGLLPLAALSGCAAEPGLRMAAHPWPGYELLYLARERGYLPAPRVTLIETPSASATLRALASRAVEGGALTLDEVLTARARGIALTVVAVVDVSVGADVVMARPERTDVRQLRGARIGVDPSATAAVMLDALLTRYHLTPADITAVPLAADEHLRAYQAREVDAVVTYEPAKTLLAREGARVLFSSAEIPGRIIDTLAVRSELLPAYRPVVAELVASHFQALADWKADATGCAPTVAPRLGLPPSEVPGAFADLELPDAQANRQWLGGPAPLLLKTADQLMGVMVRGGLLSASVDLGRLADDACLPA